MEEIGTAEPLQLDFETIKVATDDFSEENKLGKGGFGVVSRYCYIIINFKKG